MLISVHSLYPYNNQLPWSFYFTIIIIIIIIIISHEWKRSWKENTHI